MKRQRWIDLVKLLACMFVFFDHFCYAFAPTVPSVMQTLSHNPLSILINGNFAVCMFMMLSAYLIGVQIYGSADFTKLRSMVFKRYFRLMIPVLILSCITFVMKKLGLFYNMKLAELTGNVWLTDFFTDKMSFKRLVYDSFFALWWKGASTFDGPLWMMSKLFLGSFFTMLLCVMTTNKRRWSLVVFAGVLVMAILYDEYMLCFVLGALAAYIQSYTELNTRAEHKNIWIIGALLVACGIILPGLTSNISRLLIRMHIDNAYLNSKYFYNTIASFCIIIGFLLMPKVQEAINKSKFTEYSGKLSFAIYLVHWPIVCSLSCFMYTSLCDIITNAYGLFALIFGVTTIVVLGVAWLFNRFIETKICDRLVSRISKLYFGG